MLDTSVTVHAHFKNPDRSNAADMKAAEDSIKQAVNAVITRFDVENTPIKSHMAVMHNILWGGLKIGIKMVINGKSHIMECDVPFHINTRSGFAAFLRQEYTKFVADTLLADVVFTDSNFNSADLNSYFKTF